MRDVVVVGASAAGLTAAQALRREGYDGDLTIVGAEDRMPYDRPPLSKQVLSGTWEPERAELPAKIDARWRLGVSAVGLDVAAKRVSLSDGSDLPYDGLVIATGVAPRLLPFGHDLAGVHVLRSMDDALALRKDLLSATAVVIVGAGFLGAEAAAVARGLGKEVTLVDPLPAPMIRQFGPAIGGRIAGLHRENGVTVRVGVGVTGFSEADGQVEGVELADGTVLAADVVLVAIGSVPATSWLAGSGLSLTDGVDCDELCAAAPSIVAAGDVASWIHPDLGRRVRVEHRMNATEQGMAAAKTLLGKGKPFAPVPYFWTEQYAVKIQAHGTFPTGAEVTVVAAEPGKFAALYTSGGLVSGVLGWNLPRETRQLRARIGLPPGRGAAPA